MNKKLVFRKWVIQLLCLICFISVIIASSECENMKTFIISHLIATVVFVSCCLLLKRYSNIFD